MPEVGDIVTVALWGGESHEAAELARDRIVDVAVSGDVVVTNVYVEAGGDPLRWFVVADAVRYQP